MDQISPPMRIALLAAILFAAAWFTVLKPSDETAADPAPAPAATTAAPAADPNGPAAQSAPGQAAQAARGAAQTQEQADQASSDAADAAEGGTAPAPAGTPGADGAVVTPPAPAGTAPGADGSAAAPSGPATPAQAPPTPEAVAKAPADVVADRFDLPRPVAGALASRQIVVLLFWNRAGADDRAVRRAVSGLAERGKVFVQVAPVAKVSRYAAITEGADVSRSPSVVVVDRRLQAQVLPGYVARDTIRQAIADARR